MVHPHAMARTRRAGLVLMLVLAGSLLVAPLAVAETVETQVEVANTPPTIESHRLASTSQGGRVLLWVWASDLNGREDLASVELMDGAERLDVALEPSWTAGEVARFSLHGPQGSVSSKALRIVVEDGAGASTQAPVSVGQVGSPSILTAEASQDLRSVPGPGSAAVLLLLGLGIGINGLPRRRRF